MKGFYTSSFALPFSIADFKHSVVSVEFQTLTLKNRWVKKLKQKSRADLTLVWSNATVTTSASVRMQAWDWATNLLI